ncbi:MAG: DUF6165 family protein [Paracoccaceae bacterium]
MKIQIPISVGEFVDRLTILELKLEHAPNVALEKAIQTQIDEFNAAAAPIANALASLNALHRDLAAINAELWVVEDDLRAKERQQRFDQDFISLARSVYQLNDQRAALKNQMDQQVGSEFGDAKIYRIETPNS